MNARVSILGFRCGVKLRRPIYNRICVKAFNGQRRQTTEEIGVAIEPINKTGMHCFIGFLWFTFLNVFYVQIYVTECRKQKRALFLYSKNGRRI